MMGDLDGDEVQLFMSLLVRHKTYLERPAANLEGHYMVGYDRDLTARPLSSDEQVGLLSRIGLPSEIGYRWLREDIFNLHRNLQRHSWFRLLNLPRQAAVVSMAYDLTIFGINRYRGAWSMISKGDFNGIADLLADSKWIEDQGERGRELVEIIRKGHLPR